MDSHKHVPQKFDSEIIYKEINIVCRKMFDVLMIAKMYHVVPR